MVKPVYPHHKHPITGFSADQHFRHVTPNDVLLEIVETVLNDELEGAVGHASSSSVEGDDSDVFTDNVERRNTNRRGLRSLPPSSQHDGSHGPSVATVVSALAPTPVPRERISSLPNPDEDSRCSAAPIPRQRRKSAPVPIACEGRTASGVGTESLPPALRDIATKGQELFWFILSEEVKARESVEPGSLNALTIPPSAQRMEVLNERGILGGRTLRQIAEAFACSSQRSRVREQADVVDLQSLSYDSFSDLLFGLFQEGGITQARVLVLFFFCSDIALRALKEKLTYRFQQLVEWTSRYITERLSGWVYEHGGWAAVLQESVDQALKVALMSLCCVSIIACSILVVRRLLQ